MKVYKILGLFFIAILWNKNLSAQHFKQPEDTLGFNLEDTTFTIKEVPIIRFKSKDDEMEYYKDISRIRTVLPYVKIAKGLYKDLQAAKDAEKKKDFKKYRKVTEKDMRDKFEKELKNLTIGQGKVLVKLINKETGNNCYSIIKDVKNPIAAWGWQIVAKHWGYDLKEVYDPKKEWILELAIKAIGNDYNVR